MTNSAFVFSSLVLKETGGYSALCLELDVASQGATLAQAKKALYEAVSLYLESAFENNLPYLRPVPRDQDPRRGDPSAIVDAFDLRVDLKIEAHA